ncbi:MAG: SHOCT domain-containing protein [Thermoplasmata archaeon]|nr:MAG: SHOCT domain-containing protein [Thermoplasmata archaeon]
MKNQNKDLSNEKRLELLEDRHEKKEISDETYEEIKAQLTAEKEVLPPPIPPSETGVSPTPKAKKFPVLPVIIVIAIVGIILAAVAVSGGIFGGGDESNKGTGSETYTEPTKWEDTVTIEGDIAGGGPMTVMPNEEANFEVEDTVVQMDITLTWNPQSMDLDMEIFDPDGDPKGSSGNAPGEPESVRIKGKNIKPGTWTAVIDPFAAVNVHYTLEILYYHETGNETQGGNGNVLYEKVISGADKTGEETDEFNVGEDYENLIIEFVASSGSGSMTIEIKDPDGNVVFSEEVSDTGDVVTEETVDAMAGTYTVDYTFDGFTGDVVVQVTGS